MSTESGPPLRAEVAGRDLDQARAMYEDGYNGEGFDTELTDEEFAYRYTIAGDDEMTLRTSMFLGSISGAIQPQNEYVVAWLTGGSGALDVGVDESPFVVGRPTMFPTGKQFLFEATDFRESLIHFTAGYLEKVASEEEGTLPGPLTFDHTAAPTREALAQWQAAIGHAATTILGGDPSVLARSEANRLTALALLRTFPHTGPQLPEALLAPRNGRLREAVEYMHAHAHLPIDPTAIAEYAGLSLRGLQVAFRNHLDTTPTDYLRGIRLDRARADLMNLGPSDTTVAAIAGRWGFTHAGRFTARYTARFGESPAETLHR